MKPAIVLFIAMSLDGYIARPDGSVDWLAPFEGAGEDYGYGCLISRVGGLLMGRRTYEQVLGFDPWPYGTRPVFVLSSRTLPTPGESDVSFVAGSPSDLVTAARRATDRPLWLVGGARLAQSMLAAGLVDELEIALVPVLLGDGISLFGSPAPPGDLALAEARTYRSGLVMLRYRVGRAGAQPTGT
jgi:dihydrofolate reductase